MDETKHWILGVQCSKQKGGVYLQTGGRKKPIQIHKNYPNTCHCAFLLNKYECYNEYSSPVEKEAAWGDTAAIICRPNRDQRQTDFTRNRLSAML